MSIEESMMNNLPFLVGGVIPASPLALTNERKFDERHQRALYRYYMDAGSRGVAVAVHTTQFEIRIPKHGLFEPVMRLAAECLREPRIGIDPEGLIRVAGVCGNTNQAIRRSRTSGGTKVRCSTTQPCSTEGC